MKKTALLIGLGIVLTSCNLFTDPVRKSAEAYLMENLNDPSSYEFVSLVPTDTITYLENIDGRLEDFQRDLDRALSQLDFYSSEIAREEALGYTSSMTEWFTEQVETEQKNVDMNTSLVAGIDSIKTALGDRVNGVACYEYEFTYRANNAMGGLTLNRATLQITPDNEVITVAETPGKKIVYPNNFPGYIEFVRKKYQNQ
jgi:hypothetical protein